MASALPRTAAYGHLQTLFTAGTCAGLSDAQLLERFVASRDGQAFESLVLRHGPMVLAAGRAILGNRDDAEDVFQATFLILARKSPTIRCQAGLGPWLHRVASRIAIQTNAKGRRQRQSELQAGAVRALAASSHEARADVLGAVHEEIDRLPERWRRPIILCDLEGKTHAQAAAELRQGEATVRRRLAAARNRLRSRLARQGVGPLALVLATTEPQAAQAAVPEALAAAATRAAASLVAGRGPWLIATAGLAFTFLAWVATAGLATDTGPTDDPPQARASNARDERSHRHSSLAPSKQDDTAKVEIQGRVLDSNGQPHQGARIYLGSDPNPETPRAAVPHVVRAASGPDGRFRFEVARNELIGSQETPSNLTLAAFAEGWGPAWIRITPEPAGHDWTLSLIKDDVPLTGRLVDLEGRPIAGGTVTVFNIQRVAAGDLPAWLQILQDNQGRVNPTLWEHINSHSLRRPGLLPTARTNNDGRFRLTGIGRDRIVTLALTGPTIKTEFQVALTTDNPNHVDTLIPGDHSGRLRLKTPGFEVVVSPARSIEGVVRDLDTGMPLKDIIIQADDDPFASARTDIQGHYQITGLSESWSITLKASSPDQPYVITEQPVNKIPGPDPLVLDIAMKRGIWVEGRVTDRETGQGVEAHVDYVPFRDNPIRAGNTHNSDISVATDAQGRYRIVAAPGRGLLGVRARGTGYLAAPPLVPELEREVRLAFYFQLHKDSYENISALDLLAGPGPFAHEIQLEPGHSQQVKIVGPYGAPVEDATVTIDALREGWIKNQPLKAAEFTYVHPRPGTVETLIFRQNARHLGASLEVIGTEPSPLRVVLAPTATVIGRLVDPQGQPRPHVLLLTGSRSKSRGTRIATEPSGPRITTDDEGRFRLADLVPGVEYSLNVLGEQGSPRTASPLSSPWWTVTAGETKDWGDVRESTPTKD